LSPKPIPACVELCFAAPRCLTVGPLAVPGDRVSTYRGHSVRFATQSQHSTAGRFPVPDIGDTGECRVVLGCQTVPEVGTAIKNQNEETNMRKPVVIAGLALGVALAALGGKAQAYTNYPGASSGIPEGSIACFRPASNAYLMAGTADSAASVSKIPTTTLEKVRWLKDRDSRRHASRPATNVGNVSHFVNAGRHTTNIRPEVVVKG
jgi:hypothetical protein